MRLANKVALITGAASGIGKASCLRFAQEGAKIVCVDLKPADETVDEIRKAGISYLHPRKTPLRFTSMTKSQISSSVFVTESSFG